VTGVRPVGRDDGIKVVIDYREPPEFIALSEKAKALYDTGMMNAKIATELGCARSYVTKLLKYWFESRGLVMLDGRSRRASLKQKHVEPPLYQQIADEVMVLYQQKMLLQDIADMLKVDRNTVTSAICWWHQVRGLPVPDGRTRRKELEVKTSPRPENQVPEQPNAPPEGQAKGEARR
jgi:DNA-binding MarR family transcriptional regulator